MAKIKVFKVPFEALHQLNQLGSQLRFIEVPSASRSNLSYCATLIGTVAFVGDACVPDKLHDPMEEVEIDDV